MQVALDQWSSRDKMATPQTLCDREMADWCKFWRHHGAGPLPLPPDFHEWPLLPEISILMMRQAI
eukprot:4869182-Pyramimonas_sp.AAC.1